MKKLVSILLILFVIFSSGCGGGATGEGLDELLSLGQKYLLEGNYEEAIVAFEKAIKIDKKCVDAYLGMADAYVGLDDIDKAKEILQKGYDATGDERLKVRLDDLIAAGDLKQWKALLTADEDKIMQELMKSFTEDDTDSARVLMQGAGVLAVLEAYGETQGNGVLFDYGNTVNGTGMLIGYWKHDDGGRWMAVYYGSWRNALADGTGVQTSLNFNMTGGGDVSQQYSVVHCTWSRGYAEGTCEVKRSFFAADGNVIKARDTLISGKMQGGVWSGTVTEQEGMWDGRVQRIQSTFVDGIPNQTGNMNLNGDPNSLAYGTDLDTGEPTFGVDGAGGVDADSKTEYHSPTCLTTSNKEDFQIASLSSQRAQIH